MKKLFSLVLVLAMVLSLGSAMAETSPSLHLSVLGRQRSGITFEEVQELNAWKVLCDMFAENDLALDYNVVERDQYAAILNATLSSGDIPDFFYAASLSDADCVNLIENGLVMDINEALQYSDGTAAAEFAAGGLYEVSTRVHTYTDGGMYFFGNVSKQISVENEVFGPHAIVGNNCSMLIRQDWLDTLGLEMPTTLDGVLETLIAFQENDMNGNGIKDERMCIDVDSYFNGVAQWFGLAPFNFQLNRVTGEAEVPVLQEGYAEYVEFVKKCIDAGVVYVGDEVSYYNGGTSGGDGLNALMQDNCVGIYYGVALVDHAYQTAEAVYTVMPNIDGSEAADPVINASVGYKVWSRWAFSADADPKAVAAFLDTICTKEYAKWVTFGIEGDTYTIDPESGHYVFTASNVYDDIKATGLARGYMLVIDSFLPDASQIGWYQEYHGILNWNSYEDFVNSAYFTDMLSTQYTENQVANLKQICEYYGEYQLYNFNADIGMVTTMVTLDEADTLDFYLADLNTRMTELNVGFMTGLYDIADLESYKAELIDMGLEDVLAVRQAQFDRYNAAA